MNFFTSKLKYKYSFLSKNIAKVKHFHGRWPFGHEHIYTTISTTTPTTVIVVVTVVVGQTYDSHVVEYIDVSCF